MPLSVANAVQQQDFGLGHDTVIAADAESARSALERRQQAEIDSLSQHIAATYEEISLLHRLTANLKLSESDEDLAQIALEWLQGVLPAESLVIQLLPAASWEDSPQHDGRQEPRLLVRGPAVLDNARFNRLTEHLLAARSSASEPFVVNRGVTGLHDWPLPAVRQALVVPLADGENRFGWLAALNHSSDGEFGTGEASLLNSVAVILGIHNSNIALYQQHAEMTAGIIRALSAAIDAKDQYTCGHSDRVARVAVRLARELGCDQPARNTIYLAGLLHDIGKIGIADRLLQKPGSLTKHEYRQIQRHTEIGHRILRDLRKLDNVLPVILHHHESWDGSGYPSGLRGDAIPLAARIVAVADAFDAMSSNRPYRRSMSEAAINEAFRKGSGCQWDPRVVAAYFAAYDDVRRIVAQPDGQTPACGAGVSPAALVAVETPALLMAGETREPQL
jgi:putative nucleotidyltransferase with HDIG domain